MRRAIALAGMLAVLLPALARAADWWSAYERGVTAIGAGNYAGAVESLQKAIAEMPNESAAARTGSETHVYVPHFWLGIAKFNLGDADGALREFERSEQQGVVQGTRYAADLRAWMARTRKEKEKKSGDVEVDGKKEAGSAVRAAVSAQMQAVQDGADTTEAYRSGQRKLQEARDAAAKGDRAEYRRAAELASQARAQFAKASEEAKRQKSAGAKAPASAAGGEAVVSAAAADARVALQQYRRDLRGAADARPGDGRFRDWLREADAWQKTAAGEMADDAARQMIAAIGARQRELAAHLASAPAAKTPAADPRELLQQAWRAYARGEMLLSEDLLTRAVSLQPLPEAYLLRGCGRLTRALLSKKPAELRAAAEGDFRKALDLDPEARLDPAAFSSKVVDAFEAVRKR